MNQHRIVPPHMPPHRLLLVDDDALLLETLTDLLRSEGFDVTAARSGEEAERQLQSAHPPFDLVLTDLVMPGRSGMDVLDTALRINPGCTVLVLTGFGSAREATEAVDRGAYGLVNKPLQLEPFRNTLRRLMERTELVAERDALRLQVKNYQSRIEHLEATNGRMEMLAQRIEHPPESAAGTLDDLERLGSLRSKGLLTETQFEVAKKALLSRWPS